MKHNKDGGTLTLLYAVCGRCNIFDADHVHDHDNRTRLSQYKILINSLTSRGAAS